MKQKVTIIPYSTSSSPQTKILPIDSLSFNTACSDESPKENTISPHSIKRLISHSMLVLLSVFSLGINQVQAQMEPATDEMDSEEIFEMDPFTVTTQTEGYKAIDTLGGSRVRTDIADTPSSLSVITATLMRDLAVTDAEDLFVYTLNTEIAGLNGNFSGMSTRGQGIPTGDVGAEETRLSNPTGVNRARGLTAMDNTRNYFSSDIPWDGFNINRVDISRGPNSFLFGTGSPSGISNVSTNEASFSDFGSVELHLGSYESTRESLDYNRELIENELAVRVDIVNDRKQFRQKPAFSNTQRFYAAMRYDPQFLRTDTTYTKIQASYEYGDVDSNNPRILPPVDYITGYLNDPTASATGYNPWTYDMDTAVSADINVSPWASSGSMSNRYQWSNNPQLYYDAVTGDMVDGGKSTHQSPTGTGYGALDNTWNVHTAGYYSHARTSNYIYRQANDDADGGDYPGAYRGTVRYFDNTLHDSSIFDFYNKLIDGNNKREWQNWHAYNVSLVQSLFSDRLVIQAVADHQEYERGEKGILHTPIITMDLNSYLLRTPTWLPGAVTNPNVGRPLVFGDQGFNNFHETVRDNYQVTAAYNLDLDRDFNMKGFWGKLLGRHDFTFLGGRYTTTEDSREYRLNGIDPRFRVFSGEDANPLPIDNTYDWLAYLGPSMLGHSAAGADLSNLRYSITPPSIYPYTVFSNEWTAGDLDPTSAWVFTDGTGAELTQTQVDNPANYRGYYRENIATIYGNSLPAELGNNGHKRKQRLTSKAFLYQGHLWDDTVIPSFGYREDKTLQRGNEASEHQDPITRVYNFDYDITDEGVEATTISKSYGVAVHLPEFLKAKLPSGTNITFYYFHGENETPRIRYAIDGSQLPNESGETDDYSIQYDGLDGRLTARLTYFNTKNQNASASVGQPLGTSMVRSLPEWVLCQHAYSMVHRALPQDENGYFIVPSDNWESWTQQSWANWPYGWMTDQPEEAELANQAMMTKFVELYPQEYWDSYGYNINVEAIKNGDWAHIVNGTDYPYFPPQLGGSDTIHGEYPTIDQNLQSKGWELEVTFRPVKNWDITFNGSKVDATQTGLGQAAQDQLQGMADLFLDSGVQYAGIWGGYEGAKNVFLSDLWAPYLTQIALVGTEQPEMRKYRFNVITNYSFADGTFKGLNIGGAYRWQDKAILGYGIHEADIYGETSWIADVNQPIWGPTDSHFDLWVGYQRPLSDKLDWRVQLNVRNVGEDVGLVPVSYNPNGEVAQQRIQEGQTVDLSMKFIF